MPRKKPHTEATKKLISKSLTRHGMKGTRFYKIWENMKARCNDTKSFKSKSYYEKAITVCPRWQSFSKFYEDMYQSYVHHSETHSERNTTIERIDNSIGYTPKNCRWATKKEQSNNRKGNILLEYKGRVKALSIWAEETGLNRHTLWTRVHAYGWSIEKALTTPTIIDRYKEELDQDNK